MKWIPYGPGAWLLQFADRINEESFTHGCAITAELERQPPDGLREFVPGFTTILLEFDAPADSSRVRAELAGRLESAGSDASPLRPIVEVPVRYHGPDLERVAQQHGLSTEEVIQLHAQPVYRVYLLGFSPGFPYLGELDPRLHTPRLAAPRTLVKAGSVGIGGEHTGIYTVDGPGGWNIIGHTPAKIFDPERRGAGRHEEAMFLLRQGDRVKFVPSPGAT